MFYSTGPMKFWQPTHLTSKNRLSFSTINAVLAILLHFYLNRQFQKVICFKIGLMLTFWTLNIEIFDIFSSATALATFSKYLMIFSVFVRDLRIFLLS
jgi:hypothetical protein